MEYYETVPAKFRGMLDIPSKWTPGMPCPNCAADGRDGVLMLLDKGDDLAHHTSVAEWGSGESGRFELVCSAWVDDYCTFHPFSLDGVTATVADDWEEAY